MSRSVVVTGTSSGIGLVTALELVGADYYARGAAAGRHSSRLPDPVRVACTVRLVLDDPVPVARYVVGAGAVGGILAERVLPTTVTDVGKAVATGLRSLPPRRDRSGR